MPGVRKEDIDVSVQGSQVAIRAEIKRESTGGRGKKIHSERFTGEAFRAFDLPQEVDAAAAKAEYDGGVLTLTLPKKDGGTARRLQIG
jgi:HSP20 family protein